MYLFLNAPDVEGVLVQKLRTFEAILRKGKRPYSVQVVGQTDHNLLRTDALGQLTQPKRSVSTGFTKRLTVEAGKYMARKPILKPDQSLTN